MNVIDTAIPAVKIIEPAVFGDERGFFFESFNQARFDSAQGESITFLQDNHSSSVRGVLRGLHYQLAPHAQGKLVRCSAGEIFDVAVDIRRGSPTFGQHVAVALSADNKRQLWIPPGFAHGFLTLSEKAEVQYKASAYWNVNAERSILWNDTQLDIAWPLNGIEPVLSGKDAAGQRFAQAELSD